MKREEIVFGSLLLGGVVAVIGLSFVFGPKKDRPGVWGESGAKASFSQADPKYTPPPNPLRKEARASLGSPPDLTTIKDPEKRKHVEQTLKGGRVIRTVDDAGDAIFVRPTPVYGVGPGGQVRKATVVMKPGLLRGKKKIEVQSPPEKAQPEH